MDWRFQLHMPFVVWSWHCLPPFFVGGPNFDVFFFRRQKKETVNPVSYGYDMIDEVEKLFRREELKGKKWTSKMVSRQWFGKWFATSHVWVVVSNIFYFHPYYWGRFPIWLIFFRGGWNHQLVMLFLTICWLKESFFLLCPLAVPLPVKLVEL